MEVYFCLEGRLVTALSAELIAAQVSPGRREDEELPPGNPIQINLLNQAALLAAPGEDCLFALGHFCASSNQR